MNDERRPASEALADTPAPARQEGAGFARLSPEQQVKAMTLQAAMAERFSTEGRPLSAKDFGVFFVGEGDEQRAVVALTADVGLYWGSYDGIMADDSLVIDVDGDSVDTRPAMTWETYQALVKDAEERGVDLLPDSEAASARNGVFWTCTWLTGDPPGPEGTHCGTVIRTGAGRTWYNRYAVWRPVRIRPAAFV